MPGGLFYSGTSGLQTPIPKRDFPIDFQDKSRLTYYASLFNSIEINSSFYKIPIAKTIVKWAESVPDNFRFTFKLWQGITHNKSLLYNPEDIDRFIQAINGVGIKKGCLLIQLPPALTVAAEPQLRRLLTDIKQTNGAREWPLAVEFRNKSCYQDSVYELLDSYEASLVVQDLPASATPVIKSTTNFKYLRFHGPVGGYKGSYPDDFLYEYARYVKEWLADGKTVYANFNNTAGNALGNLKIFNNYVENS